MCWGIRLAALAAFCMLAYDAAAPQPARALYPHVRRGWEVGVGYGVGYGKIEGGATLNNAETDWIDGGCPQIRIGKMLSQHVNVGYYQQEWMDVKGYGNNQVFVSLQNFAAALTYYPGSPEKVMGGFYMRGAVGFSNGRVEVEQLTGANLDTVTAETYRNEGGLGLSAAIGYELRIFKSVAFGGEASFHYQSIEQAYFDKSWFFPTVLTLSWYF